MEPKYVSIKNLKFLLYDVFDAESLNIYSYFKDHSRDTFDMVLDTAIKMGDELLFPYYKEMDKNQPEFDNGTIKVHHSVKTFMRQCGEGGWISAPLSYDQSGQQMPMTVMTAFRFILTAANFSTNVYPVLTAGSAHLISAFGSKELVKTYVEKMFSGEWQGTMALTEPQAGSSLSDITTTAYQTGEGYYKIKGQKIFISCGEHDGVENVVNLLLARIKDAPQGVKGISLFVVPKKRPENGTLVDNDLQCTAIYHKMGYRGAPITQLSLGDNDDCRAWLVGEPNNGLRYMFQMMNEARVEVGMSAAATASAAYYSSLEYAKERPQGRQISEKNPNTPQIPIIRHSDIKRMLLFQRAISEGSLSLCLQCAKYVDLVHVLEGEEKEKYDLLLDLLTPITKSYPSEMGQLSVSQGLQCLGGYGYCDEFPIEQYYRDIRIHPIHEGTTGIQGMDLLGRKVTMKKGKAFMLFLEEAGKTVNEAKSHADLKTEAEALSESLKKLTEITSHLSGLAMKGEIDIFLADATLYLELFGIIAVAWQWLLQAKAASKKLLNNNINASERNFYTGKLYTFRFFYNYELPKIEGLIIRLENSDGLTVKMKPEYFED